MPPRLLPGNRAASAQSAPPASRSALPIGRRKGGGFKAFHGPRGRPRAAALPASLWEFGFSAREAPPVGPRSARGPQPAVPAPTGGGVRAPESSSGEAPWPAGRQPVCSASPNAARSGIPASPITSRHGVRQEIQHQPQCNLGRRTELFMAEWSNDRE
ncbi:uncharacterized protein LOC112530253 [Gallus gallus]|uniref:uncharacterized protein LOC112530253 n=1 Tax=Gallus gallus TaxID=9031 RepID=UPI001F02BB28|nr:uncharacterized protein LOC112530253 [Gallus gallus]